MEKFEKDSAEELALLQQLMNVMKEDNQLKRELLGCTDTVILPNYFNFEII